MHDKSASHSAPPPPARAPVALRRAGTSRLPALLMLAAMLVLAAALWTSIGLNPPPQSPLRGGAVARVPVPPLEALPALPGAPADGALPEEIVVLAPETARQINAAIPFVKGPLAAAPPFRFRGDEADRARAVECLAAAQLYEAGRDAVGQRAVAQVVLNRARHPAYPNSVCAVVFQGAERRTGCQFTFTCDGSLARRYGEDAWQEARAIAGAMLGGEVFAGVGTATHYHTDWVHPYWSASLEKLAAVDTHLFFRWPGYWGSRAVLGRAHGGSEPAVSRLAFRPAHADAAGAEAALAAVEPSALEAVAPGRNDVAPEALGLTGQQLGGNRVRQVHPQGGAYLVALQRGQAASNMTALALRLCGDQAFCHVMGWLDDRAIPKGFPVPPGSRAKLTFDYMRDAEGDTERLRFDCRLFKRPDPDQCLPG